MDSNQNNQKEIANQKQDSAINMEPIVGYQEVQVAVENRLSNQNVEPQLADQNQDQPAVSQEGQPQEADQNHNQQNVNQDRDQQNGDHQNQAIQQAANPNQDVQAAAVNVNNPGPQVDAEGARVPYGVVTIHSDRLEPVNDNYAEVRNVGMSSEPSVDEPEDLTYDKVVDDASVNDENGYSTVSRDQIAGDGGGQRRPKRNNMYESVDEVLNKEVPHANE